MNNVRAVTELIVKGWTGLGIDVDRRTLDDSLDLVRVHIHADALTSRRWCSSKTRWDSVVVPGYVRHNHVPPNLRTSTHRFTFQTDGQPYLLRSLTESNFFHPFSLPAAHRLRRRRPHSSPTVKVKAIKNGAHQEVQVRQVVRVDQRSSPARRQVGPLHPRLQAGAQAAAQRQV